MDHVDGGFEFASQITGRRSIEDKTLENTPVPGIEFQARFVEENFDTPRCEQGSEVYPSLSETI